MEDKVGSAILPSFAALTEIFDGKFPPAPMSTAHALHRAVSRQWETEEKPRVSSLDVGAPPLRDYTHHQHGRIVW